MICEGGPLNGQDVDESARWLLVPQCDGRKLLEWDDGPIYSYPQHRYVRTPNAWDYVGLEPAADA